MVSRFLASPIRPHLHRWLFPTAFFFLTPLAAETSDHSHDWSNSNGGLGDAYPHNQDELPFVLASGGGGTLNPGRHVQLAEPTPMTNLDTAMLDRVGVEIESVGASTGRLENIQ